MSERYSYVTSYSVVTLILESYVEHRYSLGTDFRRLINGQRSHGTLSFCLTVRSSATQQGTSGREAKTYSQSHIFPPSIHLDSCISTNTHADHTLNSLHALTQFMIYRHINLHPAIHTYPFPMGVARAWVRPRATDYLYGRASSGPYGKNRSSQSRMNQDERKRKKTLVQNGIKIRDFAVDHADPEKEEQKPKRETIWKRIARWFGF